MNFWQALILCFIIYKLIIRIFKYLGIEDYSKLKKYRR